MAGERVVSYPGGPARRVPDAVQVTQDLVRIPTDERTDTLKGYITDFAKEHGLEVRVIPTHRKGGRIDRKTPSFIVGRDLDRLPRVLGMSHIDTVPPWNAGEGEYDALGGTVANGNLYGRGTSDAKGGAASMLVALADRRPRHTAVLLTANEETDLSGARSAGEHFMRVREKDVNGRVLYVMDAGTDNEFATGTKGVLEADVLFRGPTAHTGRPYDGPDVADLRDHVVQRLRADVAEVPRDPILGRTLFRRTGDQSGMMRPDGTIVPRVNNIQDAATALLTYRLTREQINGKPVDSAWLNAQVTALVADFLTNSDIPDELRGEFSFADYNERLYVPAFYADAGKVRWIVDLAQDLSGRTLTEWEYDRRGLSEANHVMIVLSDSDKPAEENPGFVIVGPGKQGTFHMKDEHIRTESVDNYVHVYGEVFSQAAA